MLLNIIVPAYFPELNAVLNCICYSLIEKMHTNKCMVYQGKYLACDLYTDINEDTLLLLFIKTHNCNLHILIFIPFMFFTCSTLVCSITLLLFLPRLW